MPAFEYKVVPAPNKGQKTRGVKSAEGRFAYALERLMNEMGRDGWEYVRAETLPSEERQGLTGSTTTYRNVLVFRRERADDLASYRPRLLEKKDVPLVLPASSQVPANDPAPSTAPEPQQDELIFEAESLSASPNVPGLAQQAEDDSEIIESALTAPPSILQARAARLRGKDDMAAE